MISFAQPWYLLLMPIAAGPFILHLLNRRKLRRTEFSSLFFLRKLRERRFRWLRLRDVLLLILRTLFLAFLVLVLSGPTWKGRFPLGSLKADVVVILDDSYSTEARFDALKKTGFRVLDELSRGSRVALLTPSAQIWDTLWESPETVRERIAKLEVSKTGRDLTTAWTTALDLVEGSRASVRRVVIISDGQKHALDFLKAERIRLDIEAYCFLDQARMPDNAAVLDAELYPRVPLPAEEQTVRVRVRTKGKRDERTISLYVDERLLDERRVSLPLGVKELEFRLPQGAEEVRVALDPDSVTTDDERFVLGSGGRDLRIALVGDAGSDFLELGLEVGSGVQVQRVSPGGAASLSPLSYDLLIWDGADGLPPQAAAAALQGLPVLLLLSGDVEDVASVFKSLGTSAQGFEILAPSSLFSDLKETDRRQIRITRYSRVQPAGGRTILSLSGGDPLLIADTLQGIYYLATRFTPQHTDLVYRALFPAMLRRMVFFAAGERSKMERYIGDTLRVRVSTGNALLVETPKLHYEISPRQKQGGYLVEFAATSEPGFYRIGSETFLVNPDPAEASLVKVSAAELRKRGFRVHPLGASTPRKLWLYALIIAALCLAAEFIFIFL